MSRIFLITLLLTPLFSFAQVDTVIFRTISAFPNVPYFPPGELHDSLPKVKGHAIKPDWSVVSEQDDVYLGFDKKTYKKVLQDRQLFESIAADVKVLVLENPFEYGSYEYAQDSLGNIDESKPVFYGDTSSLPIFKIDFSKFTSLKEIIFIGNDSDPIYFLPNSIYKTGVETISYANLEYVLLLQKNVALKSKTIRFKNLDGVSLY